MSDPILIERRRRRQLQTVTTLGGLLIAAGFVILFALHRIPLPMRIMAGLGDVFVGCMLLVLANQQRKR